MKCLLATVAAVLLGQASAQTLVEKLYLMRSDTTTVDPYSGMTRICVVVLPDGHYRMERTFQSIQGGTTETKVFLDVLPPEDLKNLQAALDSDDLQRVKYRLEFLIRKNRNGETRDIPLWCSIAHSSMRDAA